MNNLQNNDPTQSYTYEDRMDMVNTLDSAFGKNNHLSGRVMDYLGYVTPLKQFAVFYKKCTDILRETNAKKTADSKACIILQSMYDFNEIHVSTAFLPQLEMLAKSYYVAFHLIGGSQKPLAAMIHDIKEELGKREITLLVVRAHGEETNVILGPRNFYGEKEIQASDFNDLAQDATIVLTACAAGPRIAKKISSLQKRAVFAATIPFSDSLVTPCCAEHGVGMMAFDEGKMVAKRYQAGQEHAPCCATSENIERIKKILFYDTLIAAEKGDGVAQCNLGIYYKRGQGVLQSHEKAVEWFRKAAEQGFAGAQFNLGVHYRDGEGVLQSHEKALYWYQKAAEQEHAPAQNNLACCYKHGKGVLQSHEKAVEWFCKAAKQGYAVAQKNLGDCYKNGEGVLQSQEKALYWYQKAAELGDACALRECENAKAVEKFRKVAEEGDDDAQYTLGSCYEAGVGVLQSYEKAVYWYRKAAKQGNDEAQFALGECFRTGRGVLQSPAKAVQLFRQAAEQGHSKAQYHLRVSYWAGEDVEQSDEE